jgi:DNA-binding MarR family transcriptional regulator
MSRDLEQLGWLIKRVQHRHHRALDANLARLGVSVVQWNALREIDRNPSFSQHQLAERTFNSDQAFGALLGRLQGRGLVVRRRGFGRASLHRLTPEGAALLREGHEILRAELAASFAPLGEEEREALAFLLTRVLDAAG